MNKNRVVGLVVLIALAVIFVQFFLGYQKTNRPLQAYRSPPVAPLQEKMRATENAPSVQSAETLMEEHFDAAPDIVPATPAWVVQIASLTNQVAAETLLSKLKSLGYDAFIVTLSVQDKPAYRVSVGPFTDQSLALDALSDIQESLKMTGILKQYIVGDVPRIKSE